MRMFHKHCSLLILLITPLMATTPARAQDSCQPSARSIESRPGREWTVLFGWRFANPADAEAAYQKLVGGMSPWADWDPPVAQTLPAGTRFAMAMAPGQPASSPGAAASS